MPFFFRMYFSRVVSAAGPEGPATPPSGDRKGPWAPSSLNFYEDGVERAVIYASVTKRSRWTRVGACGGAFGPTPLPNPGTTDDKGPRISSYWKVIKLYLDLLSSFNVFLLLCFIILPEPHNSDIKSSISGSSSTSTSSTHSGPSP